MTHFDNSHSVWNEIKMLFLKYTLLFLMFLNNFPSMCQNISECLKLNRPGFGWLLSVVIADEFQCLNNGAKTMYF